MTNSLVRAALVALPLLAVASAGAQITTVIPPAKPAEAQRVDSARRVEAARDSVARVTLTGMKEWVDSAASALAVRPDTARSPGADSAAAAVPPVAQRADTSAVPPRPRLDPAAAPPELRAGAPAPDTATSTPALALLGGILLVLGGLTLRRRRAAMAR